jgi:hypothetical protein
MLKSRRARAAIVAAGLTAGALGLLFVVLTRSTIQVPPGALAQASARPVDPAVCETTRARYLHTIETLNRCTSDDACRGEARGGFFTDLDWCARFLPGSAPRGEIDTLAADWLARGCAHDYVECADDPGARCEEGRCVERPPPGIPERWKRIVVLGDFTFFLPPDLQGKMGHGDDSYNGRWSRPGLTVDFDFSEWANPLDLDTPPVYGDHRTTRTTSINGAPARLVTARVQRSAPDGGGPTTMSGVYFAAVPLRRPHPFSDLRLNLVAWCDEPADCSEAATIFESIVFY